MILYTFRCPEHGEFDTTNQGDSDYCALCGESSRRVWRLRINAESARHRARWDPVVGEYVSNEREFRSLLRQGQDAQSEKLGMDVKLETVDARDQSALAELHHQDLNERLELKAITDAAKAKQRAQ